MSMKTKSERRFLSISPEFQKSNNYTSNSSLNSCHSSSFSRSSYQRIVDDEQKLEKTRLKSTIYRKKFLLFFLAITTLLISCCFSILAPFFPAEAEHKKHLSKTVIGLIFGIFQLANFFLSPLFGKYITILGARFTYLSGIFLLGGCSLCFGFLDRAPSGTTYMVLCFICRTLEGVGAAAATTASFAIVAHEFPDRISTAFGLMETFSGAGFIVGPFLGGVLFQLGGFTLPFAVLGGVLLTMAMIYVVIFPSIAGAHTPYTGSLLPLLQIANVCVACMTVLVGSSALGFLDAAFQPHLVQFRLTPILTGVVFLTGPSLYAILAPLWGWLADKGPAAKILIVVGNLICAVAMLLLGPSPLLQLKSHLWLTIVAMVVLGIGIGASQVPVFQELLEGAKMDGFPDDFETNGLVSGLYTSLFSLGAFIGPVAGGYMNDHVGFEWTSSLLALLFAVVALTTALFSVAYWRLILPRLQELEADASTKEHLLVEPI